MKCNLGCEYCYEEPDRHHSADEIAAGYDLEKIFDQLEDWYEKNPNYPPGLHGGEPLLLDFEDIKAIFEWISDHYGKEHGSHIQTNATRLEERHVKLFEKHNVSVGVSFDGEGDANALRKARSEMGEDGERDITDEMTQKTRDAIERLMDADVGVGIIVVLTEQNVGSRQKIESLYETLDWFCRNGVSGHFNPAIPYEDVQTDVSISPEQLKEVYLYGWEWYKEEEYRDWHPFEQYQDNLLGNALGNCVNQKCDVFNARAAEIVKGNGELTGCGKTWSTVADGVSFLQGESTGNEYEETYERYEMLKQTPPEEGGCKGCDYWKVCHGGCPASGGEYDYRNKTLWCEAKKALYSQIEEDMRAMFPGVRLVTDSSWDTEQYTSKNDGPTDIKPFDSMRQETSTHPSVGKGGSSADPVEKVIREQESFEAVVEWYREEYNEEILTIDPENNSIHADSA